MIDPAAVAATALVSSVVGAIVSSVIAGMRLAGRKAAEDRAADEAMRAALRALLWRELQIIHAKAMEDGGMTVADRRHLESVYAAYHALGGNGTGTRLYEEAMATPVLD